GEKALPLLPAYRCTPNETTQLTSELQCSSLSTYPTLFSLKSFYYLHLYHKSPDLRFSCVKLHRLPVKKVLNNEKSFLQHMTSFLLMVLTTAFVQKRTVGQMIN
ncbi:hypothetical protein L9F63_019778, partial [Diploptera punctata]